MPPGCRLPLLVLVVAIAACAPPFLVVPDEDWQTVPAGQRAAIDRQHDADLAAARAELEAATAGLAELSRPPAAPQPPPRTTPSDPDDDEWMVAVHRHEQATSFAYTRVETARTAWQTADRTWRQLRHDAATAQVDMVIAARELSRAKAIDRNLLGTDHYEVAPLRGQFSQAQQRWYSQATAASAARTVLEQASAELATAKEAYAQLMRNGPMLASDQPAAAPPADAPPPRLVLSSWSVTRSDIRRRRGLGNLLEEAERSPARLRTVKVRLPRPLAVKPMEASASATGAEVAKRAQAPAADGGVAATAAAKPVEAAPAKPAATAAKAVEPPAATAARSVEPTTKPAPAVAKPVEPTTKPATAVAKPVEPTTKPATKSVEPTTARPAATSAKPVEVPAEAPTRATASKPAQPASTNSVSRPAAKPASTTNDKPAE